MAAKSHCGLAAGNDYRDESLPLQERGRVDHPAYVFFYFRYPTHNAGDFLDMSHGIDCRMI